MKRRTIVLGLLLAVAAPGCAAPWHVVAQASPESFQDHPSFALMQVDYGGLRVGGQTEDAFLSKLSERQRESFAVDKVALDARFREAVVEQARDAGVEVRPAAAPIHGWFAIQPRVTFLDPGVDGPPNAVPVRVEMTVKIMAADGIVLDEIKLARGTDADHDFGLPVLTLDPSSGGLFRYDGGRLGKTLAAYLRKRIDAAPRSGAATHPA